MTHFSSQPSNQAVNGYVKGKGDSRCGENDGKLASAAGLALLPVKVKAPIPFNPITLMSDQDRFLLTISIQYQAEE